MTNVQFHLVVRTQDGKIRFQKWVTKSEIVDLSQVKTANDVQAFVLKVDNVRYDLPANLVVEGLPKEQQEIIRTPKIRGIIEIEPLLGQPNTSSKGAPCTEDETLRNLLSQLDVVLELYSHEEMLDPKCKEQIGALKEQAQALRQSVEKRLPQIAPTQTEPQKSGSAK